MPPAYVRYTAGRLKTEVKVFKTHIHISLIVCHYLNLANVKCCVNSTVAEFPKQSD
jgi:hypothetical protein